MNTVNLIGRLTKDPDTRYTASGMAVTRFTLAIDRYSKDKKEADFIPVKVFGKQAENVDRFLRKGRQAAVMGRIQTGSYEKKDGTREYTMDVIADRVEFLGGGEIPAAAPAIPDIPDSFAEIQEDIPF